VNTNIIPDAASLRASLTEYLLGYSHLYPSIDKWIEKSWDESNQGKRTFFAALSRNRVYGVAVIKNLERTKICHISVAKDVRSNGIGASLLAASLEEAQKNGARLIHVTTSLETTSMHGDYFSGFGFRVADRHFNRYRKGNCEHVWHVTVNSLYQNLSRTPEPFQSDICDIYVIRSSEVLTNVMLLRRGKWSTDLHYTFENGSPNNSITM
jgi:N-acetylglutamate synthase-like GNAT family acetyltransferase